MPRVTVQHLTTHARICHSHFPLLYHDANDDISVNWSCTSHMYLLPNAAFWLYLRPTRRLSFGSWIFWYWVSLSLSICNLWCAVQINAIYVLRGVHSSCHTPRMPCCLDVICFKRAWVNNVYEGIPWIFEVGRIHTHTRAHAHLHAQLHLLARTQTRTHIHIHMHTCTHAHTNMHTYTTCTHTNTRAHKRTYTHGEYFENDSNLTILPFFTLDARTQTPAHTLVRPRSPLLSLSLRESLSLSRSLSCSCAFSQAFCPFFFLTLTLSCLSLFSIFLSLSLSTISHPWTRSSLFQSSSLSPSHSLPPTRTHTHTHTHKRARTCTCSTDKQYSKYSGEWNQNDELLIFTYTDYYPAAALGRQYVSLPISASIRLPPSGNVCEWECVSCGVWLYARVRECVRERAWAWVWVWVRVRACVRVHMHVRFVCILEYLCVPCVRLKITVTRWNALQHTETQCNTLKCTVPRRNTLQHTARCCTTLQHSATHCDTLEHTAQRSTTQHHTTPHSTVLHHTAPHYTTLH